MKLSHIAAAAALLAASGALAQQPPPSSNFPRGVPPTAAGIRDVSVDADGTLHYGPRTVPPNMWVSPEIRATAARIANDTVAALKAAPQDAESQRKALSDHTSERLAYHAQIAMQTYPDVQRSESKIAGVPVVEWTPKTIPARNARRIAMEFEIDAEGVELAGIGHMKVLSVHYANGGPTNNSADDIIKVYRELLKTHKAGQIAMYGESGGCQLASTVTVQLHQMGLPMPGVLGLITCAGGDGDSRLLNNGADPVLSAFVQPEQAAPPSGISDASPRKRILDLDIPKGFPPSYMIAGVRDMALSGMARLQRKLRHAGVDCDLNIFDGGWHGFTEVATLPEAKDALSEMWRFFDRHLGT